MLGVERANAGDPGDGTAVRLQHDFGDHEPWQVVFHGFEQEISGPGVHRFLETIGAAGAPPDLSHRGSSSRPPGGGGEEVVGNERTTGQIVLSSGVPAGLESRRVSESGRQEQRGGPPPACRRRHDEEKHFRLSSRSSTPTANCDELLQARERPLCLLNAINLSLPVITTGAVLRAGEDCVYM